MITFAAKCYVLLAEHSQNLDTHLRLPSRHLLQCLMLFTAQHLPSRLHYIKSFLGRASLLAIPESINVLVSP